jgi:CheY-like chemotaxis protein
MSQAQGRKRKDVIILMAEDDTGHFQLTRKYLRRQGVKNEIIHLIDGQETLDFLLKKGDGPYRKDDTSYLLILDIHMPRINGIEILQFIRAIPELEDLPVVILTTSDNPHEMSQCRKLGVHVCVTKPFTYKSYTKALRQVGFYPSIANDGVLLVDRCS